ncbi:MAG: hypothetical protein ACXAEI_09670 [Candidatus Hodarchaeales archaeon]|jgi:hypothetical protein
MGKRSVAKKPFWILKEKKWPFLPRNFLIFPSELIYYQNGVK